MNPDLKYGMTVPHFCGVTFKVRAIEFPPKILICPGCGDVLSLLEYDPENDVMSYSSRNYHE